MDSEEIKAHTCYMTWHTHCQGELQVCIAILVLPTCAITQVHMPHAAAYAQHSTARRSVAVEAWAMAWVLVTKARYEAHEVH